MMIRDIPNSPWEEITADIFMVNHKDYILISDTFSKYPFLFTMPKKTDKATITRFQKLFAQYGPTRTVLFTVDSHFLQKNVWPT